ncbi:MAG: V-type ATP synthase subunit D [Candidatus Omnitrophica bacterium]|nr:V-type ATP synthase subunit D [Candidatus Omnitrophota bacterium]MBU1997759.1 V-type ATP synthase subunit D [Candidatus Omnitrophota bacterium]MBU4333325.1 V-type ATP synthase subunit D [Candidatus Omnitrophota bacterium]
MAKIKFTKGELKRQRDALKQFQHYLPTLQLKKQQLQVKILEARKLLSEKEKAFSKIEEILKKWVGLLNDPRAEIKDFVELKDINLTYINIAGAEVPVFKGVVFEERAIDIYDTPLWVDKGVASIREALALFVEVLVIKQQIEILQRELRITTQRVNLFEKIKIPECLENIRVIRIYLGDQQANAVGISKVAKRKIEEKMHQEALA